MKILSYISSLDDPASRFRIVQYKKPLEAYGVDLNYKVATPAKDSDPPLWLFKSKRTWNTLRIAARLTSLSRNQKSYDLIWQNRLLIYESSFLERTLKIPYVFDVDDAIWLTEGEASTNSVIAGAAAIFAGNSYLADYSLKFNKNVYLIPTTIDTVKYKPLESGNTNFVVGWIGSKSNLEYLQIVRLPLLKFLQRNHDAKLVIVSSEPPQDFPIDGHRIVFKNWSPFNENERINEFSVGIMPLPDTHWTKGKCSFKMLQYMACGKPVIVSPYGQNAKILQTSGVGLSAICEEDWLNGLERYKDDSSLYQYDAKKGRHFVEKNYCTLTWAARIKDQMENLIRN